MTYKMREKLLEKSRNVRFSSTHFYAIGRIATLENKTFSQVLREFITYSLKKHARKKKIES